MMKILENKRKLVHQARIPVRPPVRLPLRPSVRPIVNGSHLTTEKTNQLKSKKWLIIQAGKYRSGSTLLVNLLQGLIDKKERIYFDNMDNFQKTHERITKSQKNIHIIKTHNVNFDKITRDYQNHYQLFFVCSERGEKKINSKFYSCPNVICFQYHQFNVTEENKLENVVNMLYNRLSAFFKNIPITLNQEDAIERINNMNELYEKIKKKPFDYVDNFYELHGSHRERTDNDPLEIQVKQQDLKNNK